jgi:hypothetical protein
MGSTTKAEGCFVGALRTAYTKHFVQPQSIDLPEVAWAPYAELLKPNYVAIASRYMRTGGWDVPSVYKQKASEEKKTAVAKLVALRVGGHRITKLPDTRFRARGPKAAALSAPSHAFFSSDLKWLFSAMRGGPKRSSSEQLMCAIAGLNALLKNRSFDELNLIMGMVRPQRLSPELMLTFARLTFPVRDFLSNWFPFVRKIKNELDRRELDPKKLLKGLI